MKTATRALFLAYCSQVALLSAAASAETQFTVAPAVQQKLIEVQQAQSDFLSRINLITVVEQEGDKVGVGVTRTIAGRTNTSANNSPGRTPTNPTDTSDGGRYRCEKTEYDTAIKYATLDAWRHKPEFQQMIRNAILKRQGLDRILIGWNGTSVAAATDRAQNPLLQDVNKGWLYKIRTYAPARVLDDGNHTANPTKAIYVAADGDLKTDTDYVNLDALVFDAIELLDEWNRDDTELVVICGRDLVHDKYFNLVNAAGDKATEQLARDVLLSTKKIGGLPAARVPGFPAGKLLITRLDNLSIYEQEESRRRFIVEEPKFDQVANYESVNEAFVVEEYGLTALVENIVMGKKPA